MTSAVKKSFEIVLLAVSQKWPVLLYGPAGAGKTALISKFARDSRNRGIFVAPNAFVFYSLVFLNNVSSLEL